MIRFFIFPRCAHIFEGVQDGKDSMKPGRQLPGAQEMGTEKHFSDSHGYNTLIWLGGYLNQAFFRVRPGAWTGQIFDDWT